MSKLTHLDDKGAARMVDISGKAATARIAIAEGFISMSADALRAVRGASAAKGDVIAVARIAAIQAAKRTADLIPLCHPLPLSSITVDFALEADGVRITASAATSWGTGVEMEAMTAVGVGLLTIYDMVKAVDKAMVIRDIRLLEKHGGKSGSWTRPDAC